MPETAPSFACDRHSWWARHPWWRIVAAGLCIVAALFVLRASSRPHPFLRGDGWEYYYQVQTLYSHGTPDIRPDDVDHVKQSARRNGFGEDPQPTVPYAYFPGRDGRMYPLHFWAYAASAVPARAILDATGGEELASLQIANAWWAMFGLCAILFYGPGSIPRRVVLAALTAIGPVYSYWQYTGAELYSYGLISASLVAIGNRRYPLASLFASLASFQNQPIALLAGCAVLMAVARKQWYAAIMAIAGAAVSLLPLVFYKVVFDNWNPLSGFTKTENITFIRTWSMLTDLSQGLLPYVPFLVILALVGVIRLAMRLSLDGVLVALALAGMAAAAQTHVNWNSACIGVQRYLVWMLPIYAWLAVEGVWHSRWGRVALVIGVIVHALLMEFNEPRADGIHSPLAQYVLNNCPELYYIEPELFVERTLCRDGMIVLDGIPTYPEKPPVLPFGYADPNGNVTKLMVDEESIGRLSNRYEVTPEYLNELRQRTAGRSRPFYVHPPAGTVRLIPMSPTREKHLWN